MWFKVKNSLTGEDIQRGMKVVINDGLVSTVIIPSLKRYLKENSFSKERMC